MVLRYIGKRGTEQSETLQTTLAHNRSSHLLRSKYFHRISREVISFAYRDWPRIMICLFLFTTSMMKRLNTLKSILVAANQLQQLRTHRVLPVLRT